VHEFHCGTTLQFYGLKLLKEPLAMSSADALGTRLRELRLSGWPEHPMTQPLLAQALGVSVPLVSSWEKGTIPPLRRIDGYARLFGAGRAGPRGEALAVNELTADEFARYRQLLTDLTDLRAGVEHVSRAGEIRSPLQFPIGQAITIVCSELSSELRQRLGYADERDPNFIRAYQYADLDSLIELHGFINSINPGNPITVSVPSELTTDQLNAHLVVLGGVDFNWVSAAILKDLTHVPVAQRERQTDADEGAFTVGSGRAEFRPRLVVDVDRRILREDVALFLRSPNPYNRERSATLCNGMFSRGTLGVVRALTDRNIRNRNNEYVSQRFRGRDTYSILCRVKLVANEIVVPDWALDEIRLHEWPEDEE
jgi:transcriptional regulator with XRE-family HTH domain